MINLFFSALCDHFISGYVRSLKVMAVYLSNIVTNNKYCWVFLLKAQVQLSRNPLVYEINNTKKPP